MSLTGTGAAVQNIPQIDVYLTAKELSPRVHMHPVTLLRFAREGRIPHCRISARKILFPLSKIHEWMESTCGYTDTVSRAAQPERKAA